MGRPRKDYSTRYRETSCGKHCNNCGKHGGYYFIRFYKDGKRVERSFGTEEPTKEAIMEFLKTEEADVFGVRNTEVEDILPQNESIESNGVRNWVDEFFPQNHSDESNGVRTSWEEDAISLDTSAVLSKNLSENVPKPTQPCTNRTKVVNLKTDRYDVYIGRKNAFYQLDQSLFANPFSVKTHTRTGCIEKYRDWFYKQLENPEFHTQVLNLKGKVLGCWCKPKTCHGDIIVEYLESYFAEIAQKATIKVES